MGGRCGCFARRALHVGDLGGDGAGVVAVHEVGVAFGGDEVLGGFGFAAGVEGGAAVRPCSREPTLGEDKAIAEDGARE